MADTRTLTVPHIPTGKPALALDTESDRQHITIDGAAYMLRSLDDYAPSDFSRLLRMGDRMRALIADDEQTQEQGEELKVIIGTLARQALEDVPDDVFDRLRLRQRMAIANAFFHTPQATKNPTPAPSAEADPSAGASSPVDSPASTAAAPLITG